MPSPSLIPTPAPSVQFSSQPPSPPNQALFDSRDKALRAIACGPRGGVAVAAWLCCFAVAPRGIGLLTWHCLFVLLRHTGRENMPKNVKRGLTQDSCSFTVRNGATTERMLHRGQGPTSAKFLAGTVDKKSQVCVCLCGCYTWWTNVRVDTLHTHTRHRLPACDKKLRQQRPAWTMRARWSCVASCDRPKQPPRPHAGPRASWRQRSTKLRYALPVQRPCLLLLLLLLLTLLLLHSNGWRS